MSEKRYLLDLAVAIGMLIAGAWLLLLDVHADQPRDGDDQVAFCGSAYDVVLLRGDGDMGGEPVLNQAAIDMECVRKAGRAVVAGTAAGTAGLVLIGVAVLWPRRE